MSMRSIALFAMIGMASAGRHLGRSLSPEEPRGSLVKPLKFNQRLLLCNAYPSKSAVAVSKNSQPVMNGGIAFQQCTYIPQDVLSKDKLDFVLNDAGIEGTFEVGELPQTDSVLLLVLQKRDSHSPLMAFQSFAFPMNSGKDDAHVAVIDASTGSAKAHLKITDRPAQPQDKPSAEELSFNRIYALSQGKYDVSILSQGKQNSQQEVDLVGQRDYVLLRTGGEDEGAQTLVAFPHDEIHSGAAQPVLFTALIAVLASMLL